MRRAALTALLALAGCATEFGEDVVTSPGVTPLCVVGCIVMTETDNIESQPNLETLNKTKSKTQSGAK